MQDNLYKEVDIRANKIKELKEMGINPYAEKFDDGYADDDEVRKAFVEKCKAYGLEEADYKNFYVDAYDYKPRDPNDDSGAHDLGFSFTRLPADVIEEDVDEHCLKQYYNVSRG